MTNPSGFVSNLILLILEKCHCVKLLPDEVRRVRLASRELLRQGHLQKDEINLWGLMVMALPLLLRKATSLPAYCVKQLRVINHGVFDPFGIHTNEKIINKLSCY